MKYGDAVIYSEPNGIFVSVFECNTGAKSGAFVDSSVQLLHIFCYMFEGTKGRI